MVKGSAKFSRATATLPPLKQARLVGINDHVKSIRHKSTALNPNSALDELKQAGLAAFGFGGASKKTPDRRDAIETPHPKRQRQLAADLEVPETQFALNTQSPELCDYDLFAKTSGAVFGEEHSSQLSSPPLEVSSPISLSPTNPFIAMLPPPAAPVTPKRRRVMEVPDSKSPPVTPFTPYASQQRKNWLDPQSSPTARKSISPIVPWMEEYSGRSDECHSPTPIQLPQRLFTPSPKGVQQQSKDSEEETHKEGGRAKEIGGVADMVEEAFGDRDRTIKSSQWWENEDTENFPLSTQITQEEQVNENITALSDVGHDSMSQESEIRLVHGGESFRVDLSYKSNPSTVNTDESDGAHELQGSSRVDQEGNDMQESLRSMTYPVLEFCGDTPEPKMGDRPLTDEDLPNSTASQEGPGDADESQEYPAYGAYRTQQFPSSFYQHNNFRHPSPEIPPSSQFIPQIVSELGPVGEDDSCDQVGASLFLSGVVGGGLDISDEGGDKEGSSQVLPGMINGSDAAVVRDDSQLLPALINRLDAESRGEVGDGNHEDGQGIGIRDEDDDDEGGRVGWRDGTVTRSQLLPSELMETFPMPPPLSQFSSYGPYGYEFDESETQ